MKLFFSYDEKISKFMKRTIPERLSTDMIKKALCMGDAENAVAAHFTENAVIEAWRMVLGSLADYSTGLELRDGMLHVHITSPMLRNDLFMQRTSLIEKLNAAIGRRVVFGIVFR